MTPIQTMNLTQIEVKVIETIRNAKPYSGISVEKRPTKESPEGSITAIIVEERERICN